MSRCPDDAVLFAAPLPPAVQAHLSSCASCQAREVVKEVEHRARRFSLPVVTETLERVPAELAW